MMPRSKVTAPASGCRRDTTTFLARYGPTPCRCDRHMAACAVVGLISSSNLSVTLESSPFTTMRSYQSCNFATVAELVGTSSCASAGVPVPRRRPTRRFNGQWQRFSKTILSTVLMSAQSGGLFTASFHPRASRSNSSRYQYATRLKHHMRLPRMPGCRGNRRLRCTSGEHRVQRCSAGAL